MNTNKTKSPEASLASLSGLIPHLEALYTDVHAHPELSMQETRTSSLARRSWNEATTCERAFSLSARQ